MKPRSLTKKFVIVLLLICSSPWVFAQGDFYNAEKIQDIRIYFLEPDWKEILDSLIFTGDGTGRLLGDASINGTMFRNVGIRYKGFSSVDTNFLKNPFSIALDYQVKNRNYQGFTDIKLSNVIHDPSFIREVLSYEIARKYLPEPGANFANVYVNDTLIGLYTNVEAVNEGFSKRRYPPGKNTFFKGDPEVLQYPFGENANLAHSHGDDSLGYLPYYALESDYGWNDLYRLIRILNEQPDSIETVLNVDRTLWMHALNFVLLNLDSYIGYAQNYYMYRDENGRFNPILWDLNMSFGSFRHSDGSYHFNGITIAALKVLDPLTHLDFCVSPRPLMTQLFSNERYRKIFFAHMRTILNENIRNGLYYERAAALQSLITPSVVNDSNKFYPDDDFTANLDTTVGGSGGMILYPGIRELMRARMSYLDGLNGFSGSPVINGYSVDPPVPDRGEKIWITTAVSACDSVMLAYRNSSRALFVAIPMCDDGAHHDGQAGDGIYGAVIVPEGYQLQFYFYAENDSTAVFSPERASTDYFSLQPRIRNGDLTINEIMNEDQSTGSWIEICNNTPEDLGTNGWYLSDTPSFPLKWSFPDTLIPAKSYLVINTGAGSTGIPSSLRLNNSGGTIIYTADNGSRIDSVTYSGLCDIRSAGRYPNGYGNFLFMNPTPEACNSGPALQSDNFLLFPNPAADLIRVELTNPHAVITVNIYDVRGVCMMTFSIPADVSTLSKVGFSLDVSLLPSGFYSVNLSSGDSTYNEKLVLY